MTEMTETAALDVNVAKRAEGKLKQFKREWRYVFELIDKIEEAGDIEQLVREQRAKLAALEREEDAARARIADACNDIETAIKNKEAVEAEIASARLDATAAANALGIKAAALVEDARQKAMSIIAEAKDQAERMAREAKAAEDTINARIAVGRDTLRQVNETLAERQSALDGVKAQIAKLAGS